MTEEDFGSGRVEDLLQSYTNPAFNFWFYSTTHPDYYYYCLSLKDYYVSLSQLKTFVDLLTTNVSKRRLPSPVERTAFQQYLSGVLSHDQTRI